jgi:hypothetical protein
MKTAIELLDEVIKNWGGDTLRERMLLIKAAIERELEESIRFQPISELPDKMPDGCVIMTVSNTGVVSLWRSPFPQLDCATHFCILPFQKPERKLHRCYMPGCGGMAVAYQYDSPKWHVQCIKCNATGPQKDSESEAKDAWGWE